MANQLAMEMIKSSEVVRESTLLGHLSLKQTLSTTPLKQRITVVKVPKPFAIDETEEPDEEKCKEETSRRANERKDEIEQALRDEHEDQAWSLASAAAESYLEWRCRSSVTPKTKECFSAANIGERSCGSPATRLTRKLQRSRRQAAESQTKMSTGRAEEIRTRAGI